MEYTNVLQYSVGCLYEQRLLTFCLIEEVTHASSQPTAIRRPQGGKVDQANSANSSAPSTTNPRDYLSGLRKALPAYETLGSAAAFVQYYYLVYPKESADDWKLKDAVIKQKEAEYQVPASDVDGAPAHHKDTKPVTVT